MNEREKQAAWHEETARRLREPNWLWRLMLLSDLHEHALVLGMDDKQDVDRYGQPLDRSCHYWIDVYNDWDGDIYTIVSGPVCPLPNMEEDDDADET